MIDSEDLRDLAGALTCSQCGHRFTEPACGPTHAVIAADPTQHHAVAPVLRQARADLLEETANAWTQGEWAKHMVHASDPAQVRIGSANRFGDWLRARARLVRRG